MTLDWLKADKEELEGKKVSQLRAEHQEGQTWAEQRVAKAICNLRDRVGDRNASTEAKVSWWTFPDSHSFENIT